MTGSTEDYAPHPHIGGRTAALRALTAWRGAAPGAARVVVVTGGSGRGRSRLLTGFLMLCEPEYRKRLPLDEMDPSTVPPELPTPAVPAPDGLTAAQVLWLLADHYELNATSVEAVYAELAALDEPVTVVVPDVDRAGAVRTAGEPARLVREVLSPWPPRRRSVCWPRCRVRWPPSWPWVSRLAACRSSISTSRSGPTPRAWYGMPRQR